MGDPSQFVIFIIVAFAFGLILIMKKDTVPAPLRRPLAIAAVVMMGFAFFLMVYSFFIA